MSAGPYTPEQLIEWLTAGAAGDSSPRRAAIHLLTFTELPHRRGFADLLFIEPEAGIAHVHSWTELAGAYRGARLGSAHAQMLELAVSLATGEPVDLRENISVGGWAHTRRVIEAFLIAAGGSEYFKVTTTAAYDEMMVAREALAG